MKEHSKVAWDIASKYSALLASETRDLAAHIDAALNVERERCAHIALAIDSNRGNEKEIARAIRAQD